MNLNNPPLVSVLLTSFNHELYLREAIDSVLNQSFVDFELIILDDSSSDGSWDIIQSYQDRRIIPYLGTEKSFGARNMNHAIAKMARGKYIAIHHSDDVWHPQKLEKQVDFLESNPDHGACFTFVTIIDDKGNSFDYKKNIFYQKNRKRHEWLKFFWAQSNALCHPSVLIKKEVYETCGLYRYALTQLGDLDMWIRVCMKYEIHILPEPLIYFRRLSDESNESANRPDTRNRLYFNLFHVLNQFKAIQKKEDFLSIFPEMKSDAPMHPSFSFAYMALNSNDPAFVLWGWSVIFELLQDGETRAFLKDHIGFTIKDFHDIVGGKDLFNYERISKAMHIAKSLQQEKNALEEICAKYEDLLKKYAIPF